MATAFDWYNWSGLIDNDSELMYYKPQKGTLLSADKFKIIGYAIIVKNDNGKKNIIFRYDYPITIGREKYIQLFDSNNTMKEEEVFSIINTILDEKNYNK